MPTNVSGRHVTVALSLHSKRWELNHMRKAPDKKVLDYTVGDMLSPTLPNKKIVIARGLMLAYFSVSVLGSHILARATR